MKIELLEEQRLLRDTVRRFADEVVAPRAREIDESGEFPMGFFKQAAELGLGGVAVPEEYGGAGMDNLAYCLVIEEVSRACASSGVILSVNNSLVCDPLLKFGNEEQKRTYLKPLASGEKLGCFALTEPGAGSDAGALRTTARRDGDDYVLNGNKVFITNGTHADLALVFATVDLEKKHRGITAFIVPVDTPGFSRGGHEYKLGVNASGTTELAFQDMRVPASQRVGEEGEGFKIAMATLDGGRVGISAQAVGIARGAFEEAMAYAQERQQFGKPIADFQGVQFQIARVATELEASRLLVYNAARLRDAGRPFLREAAMCKLFSSEVAERVTSLAVNLFGGNGFVKDYPVEKLYRDAKIGQIYEGTSNLQLQTIAKQVLGS